MIPPPARRGVAAGLWSAGWAAGWWLGWRLPVLDRPPRRPDPTPPKVAVVVPARNEERSLGALMASLSAQTLAPVELVVVDDGSHDATVEIARRGGARVLPAGEPPVGWTGKAWACHRGVVATTAELVVLLDADVTLGPDALAVLVAEHDRHGGLLSVLPHHQAVEAYEQCSAVCNLVSVMGTGAAQPGADGRADGAFGPCLVTRRTTLDAVGGFAAVAGEVVEDLALARRYRDAGLAVTARAGGPHVAFRMYPDGPGQLVEGWTKNLAAGAAAVAPWRSALVAGWITAGLAGPLSALRRRRTRAGLVLAVLAWVAGAVQLHVLARRLGRFRWWVGPSAPAQLVAFTALVARSAWARRRGSVRWKGRQVPVGPSSSSAVRGRERSAILANRARL